MIVLQALSRLISLPTGVPIVWAMITIHVAMAGPVLAGEFADLLRAAEQGHVTAQSRLGHLYLDGRGGRQDDKEAMRWLRLAAEQGDARAQNGVGTLFDNGRGVKKNYQEAAKWFLLAANQGNALARRNLGWMYEKGQGFQKDYIKSYMWQALAERARGNKSPDRKTAPATDRVDPPCSYCAAVARKMTPNQIAQAQELVRNWQPGGP
ncbi:MAG: sel1 repeat family protein [Magnetococcus sp. DMHC-1]|nr:sel1 repeat family protein [Magnetococcales bacterium]